MSAGFLWIKALHIVFVTCWFAGLFYLPRIFVNLAMAEDGQRVDHGGTGVKPTPEVQRLRLMARKLYRFMMPLATLALLLGLVLWLYYGVGRGPGSGWMHVKLAIVLGLVAYHLACGALLRAFEAGRNRRSHRWFRVFNEAPVLALLAVVVLVVVKPF